MLSTKPILEKRVPGESLPSMDYRARLVHAEGQTRIVLVQAFQAERCLGSALGEAPSAEEAEDRALHRLQSRFLAAQPPKADLMPSLPSTAMPPSSVPMAVPAAKVAPGEGEAPPMAPDAADPEDWSADLGQLDRLLRQLGWGRQQESTYLQRLLGLPSRSRITRYADLLWLRQALEALPAGSQPESAALPLRRADLLEQCDGLLQQLGWTTERARQSLETQFAVTSRQLLSEEQLLAFNLLLESELIHRPPDA